MNTHYVKEASASEYIDFLKSIDLKLLTLIYSRPESSFSSPFRVREAAKSLPSERQSLRSLRDYTSLSYWGSPPTSVNNFIVEKITKCIFSSPNLQLYTPESIEFYNTIYFKILYSIFWYNPMSVLKNAQLNQIKTILSLFSHYHSNTNYLTNINLNVSYWSADILLEIMNKFFNEITTTSSPPQSVHTPPPGVQRLHSFTDPEGSAGKAVPKEATSQRRGKASATPPGAITTTQKILSSNLVWCQLLHLILLSDKSYGNLIQKIILITLNEMKPKLPLFLLNVSKLKVYTVLGTQIYTTLDMYTYLKQQLRISSL